MCDGTNHNLNNRSGNDMEMDNAWWNPEDAISKNHMDRSETMKPMLWEYKP